MQVKEGFIVLSKAFCVFDGIQPSFNCFRHFLTECFDVKSEGTIEQPHMDSHWAHAGT